MEPLAKGYQHKEVEGRWYDWWVQKGLFTPEVPSTREPFCIVIPPPNVTGVLHMGHALTFTIQDILTRWKRMSGFNTLWLPGTDHAGIATQMVVERELAKKGLTRWDLGREAFLKEVWAWKEKSHSHIVSQMKALGVSVDWTRERFTLDPGLSRAVRTAFVRLYEEGLIYRAERMVNWSPAIRTVLSDLEVEEREVQGHLWYIAYPVVDSDERIVVATTRPETMLGDTAVAVHPEDARYKHLIGRFVMLPLAERPIPVIADADAVDPSFGTGALKITPAHDFADFETGKRHGLPMIDIFTDDAHLNENVPLRYRGMDRFEAREAVVRDLKERGLLVKVEDYKHIVGHCQRSGVVVEPRVSLQWFVKMKPLAEPAIEAVRRKEGDPDLRTIFVPETWEKVYFHWMENIRDWCISRQLWWGHQIPVWYCQTKDCDGLYVGIEDPTPATLCKKCGGNNFVQDPDVLDTWFSSALWPFSTLGWPDETQDLKTFYPTSVMETGFDILFFWVARMMMMGLHFLKKVPFRTVYFHAMVRDAEGKKMSKTKGNVVDPLEVVEEVGADALRFTLAVLTAQGRDIKLSYDRIKGYREFVNKVWNAARFVFLNLEGFEGPLNLEGLAPADKWILTRTADVLQRTQQALEEFKFNEAASGLYQFIWHKFCDWYLELSKGAIAEGGERAQVTKTVLIMVLDRLLRALHPFMPFVTEELWQRLRAYLGEVPESIAVAKFPVGDDLPRFEEEAVAMDEVLDLISAVRAVRNQTGVPAAEWIEVKIAPKDSKVKAHLEAHLEDIKRLGRVGELEICEAVEKGAGDALVVLPFAEVLVGIGAQRVDTETKRLLKEIEKAKANLEVSRRKLENPAFLERAPAEVVEAEQEKAAEIEMTIRRLEEALRGLGVRV